MRPGFVRIIGGKWRGRRLPIPQVAALRPTPDRVRETLFNWLQPVILGAHCLDTFAGSGALGFEALSRGAAKAVLVDYMPAVINTLEQNKQILSATEADIYQASIPEQLILPLVPFNIVFIDPPYASNLLTKTCFYLEEQHFLAEKAHIYLEAKAVITDNDLPANWRIVKAKEAGAVFYHLVQRIKV